MKDEYKELPLEQGIEKAKSFLDRSPKERIDILPLMEKYGYYFSYDGVKKVSEFIYKTGYLLEYDHYKISLVYTSRGDKPSIYVTKIFENVEIKFLKTYISENLFIYVFADKKVMEIEHSSEGCSGVVFPDIEDGDEFSEEDGLFDIPSLKKVFILFRGKCQVKTYEFFEKEENAGLLNYLKSHYNSLEARKTKLKEVEDSVEEVKNFIGEKL